MLAVQELSKRFDGAEVLSSVDLTVERGQIVGLIGPNGSGKTTLLNILTGLVPASRGRVRFGDRDITGLVPHAVAGLGIARTFQEVRVFCRMTVADNVRTAQRRPGRPSAELLNLFRLGDVADVLAGDLPLPARRRLELTQVVAGEPTLLLLDEPTGGMTPRETDEVLDTLARLRDLGITILFTEHKFWAVRKLAGWAVVLNAGRKIAEGLPAMIEQDPAVRRAYLGE